MNAPTEQTAARIFGQHFPDEIRRVTRFETGLCHYVYEVITTSDEAYVVRIATPETRGELEGGLFWYPRLKTAGVPVPELYARGNHESFAYMLMDRLPGTDLGDVYAELASSTKQALAETVVRIQQAVGSLPKARRFGFAASYDQINTSGKASWGDVVRAGVERSEQWMRKVGRIDTRYVDRVQAVLANHATYLNSVKPVPFLDDLTTKNVIINNGELSGVVDTDSVCFGDPLFTVGLTHMSLLSLGLDTDYIDFWLDAMQATNEQRTIMRVYTLTFCLGFMGELGQVFNKHIEFDEAQAEHLREIFEKLEA